MENSQRKIIFIAIWMMLFAGCVNKNNPPGNIIQRDSMETVMWDMIRADQYAKLYLAKDSCIDLRSETIKLYEEVLQIHHITKDKFDKSYQYYLTHQDLNKILFDSLYAKTVRERHQPITATKPRSLPKPVRR
jgi:hypothetical protein